MSNEIINFCKEIAAEGLPISAVWVEPIAQNQYQISVSINKMVAAEEVGTPLVDQKDVPKGVGCREIHRWPNQTREISANEEQIEAMVAELAKYGKSVDWVLFDDGKFLTKPSRWYAPINVKIRG